MIPVDTLVLFLTTTFVVVLSPGPAAIAVSSEAASAGGKCSLWVIFGIALANVVFFVLSGTGIAALILASHTLFLVIKWVGVLYLLYLGLSAIFSTSGGMRIEASQASKRSNTSRFLRGFVLELSNPKALLYFSALLPQFIDPSQGVFTQLAVLCVITFVIDFTCYSFYALLGVKSTGLGFRPNVINWINRAAGSLLIFAGLKMSTIEN